MERSSLQSRQRRRQSYRDWGIWFAWTSTLSVTFLSLAWYYGEVHLVHRVAENLSRRARWYSFAIREGGLNGLSRLEPGIEFEQGALPPRAALSNYPSSILSPYAVYQASENREILLRSGSIQAISLHVDDLARSHTGFWILLNPSNTGGLLVWIFVTDRLSDTEIWRTWLIWALTSGILVGTLGFLRQELLQPLRHVLLELPDVATLRMNLLPERGSFLAQSVCRQLNRFLACMNTNNEQQRTLLRGLTHDLRGPLGRIKLRSEQLAAGLVPADEIIEDVKEMDADVDQLCELTNTLYAYADSLADQRDCHDIEISELLAQVVNSYNREHIRLDAERQIIRLNPLALKRSLNNLIDNALEYGLPPVLVCARSGRGFLTISVEDHGPGLRPATQLLMPRMPASGDRHETAHRGLGLGIVEQFCLAHGGTLALSNSAHGGLRAEMQLPLRSGA
jgi:signal transduction histidine kinase